MALGLLALVIGCGAERPHIQIAPEKRHEKAPSIERLGPTAEPPSDLNDEVGTPVALPSAAPSPAPSVPPSPKPRPSFKPFFPKRPATLAPSMNVDQPSMALQQTYLSRYAFPRSYIREAEQRLSSRVDLSARELRAKLASGQALTAAERRCVAAYDRFYEKREIEIRIALGYDDAEGLDPVDDNTTAPALLEYLSHHGFAPGAQANERVLTVEGPDGRPRVVRVSVQVSSASISDAYNRGGGRAQQEAQSATARWFFLRSLQDASDVVMYLGHSRDGGGPGFFPPRLIEDRAGHSCEKQPTLDLRDRCEKYGKDVDYDWYHRHPRSKYEMLSALASVAPELHPKLLVLGSCYSDLHFGAGLRSVAPEMGTLLTRSFLGARPMPGMAISTIENLVDQRCRADFIRPLLLPELLDEDGKRLDGNPVLRGFF